MHPYGGPPPQQQPHMQGYAPAPPPQQHMAPPASGYAPPPPQQQQYAPAPYSAPTAAPYSAPGPMGYAPPHQYYHHPPPQQQQPASAAGMYAGNGGYTPPPPPPQQQQQQPSAAATGAGGGSGAAGYCGHSFDGSSENPAPGSFHPASQPPSGFSGSHGTGRAPASNGSARTVAPASGPPPSGGSGATYAFGARPKPQPPGSQYMSSSASSAPGSVAGGGPNGAPPPASAAAAALLAAPALRPARSRLGPQLDASCPMVCLARTVAGARDALPLQIRDLQFDALVYVSQAFVRVQMMSHYPKGYPEGLPLMIFIPKSTDTTITDLAVENQTRGCIFSTVVVPKEDTARFGGDGGGKAPAGAPSPHDMLARDPELFMLFLPPGLPGDNFKVTFSYLQPLVFEAGRYKLQLPTRVPDICLPPGSSINGVLDVSVTVTSGAPGPVEWLGTHPTTVVEQQAGSVSLTLDREQAWPNDDVIVSYSVWRNSMTAMLHVTPALTGDDAAASPDPRGSICLMVSPPGPECSVPFSRSVVFIFDRSGSMVGDPLRYAKAALVAGLRLLGPQDEFTVVAFDHEQEWWTDGLSPATPDNLAGCQQWITEQVSARGTTNIMAPLTRTMRILQGRGKGGVWGLPFIFLITDGCVENEREICSYVEAVAAGGGPDPGPPLMTATTTASYYGAASAAHSSAPSSGPVSGPYGDAAAQQQQQPPSDSGYSSAGATAGGGGAGAPAAAAAPATPPPALVPRVFTFGIGPYCNHYFLKQLATIGRGMSDSAFRPHVVQAQMERMLVAASLPLLSDITLRVQDITKMELFPAVLPDLFCGQPLLVVGKYEGAWPTGAGQEAQLHGYLPNGEEYVQQLPALPVGSLPIDKVFAKGRLDLLTSQAWLLDNPPDMVRQIIELSVASGVVTPHTAMAGFETSVADYKKLRALPAAQRRQKIIRWAIGGAAGVGIVAGVTIALTFGSLASSLANTPIADAMAGAGGGDIDAVMQLFGGGDCCGGDCGGCSDCHGCDCNVC